MTIFRLSPPQHFPSVFFSCHLAKLMWWYSFLQRKYVKWDENLKKISFTQKSIYIHITSLNKKGPHLGSLSLSFSFKFFQKNVHTLHTYYIYYIDIIIFSHISALKKVHHIWLGGCMLCDYGTGSLCLFGLFCFLNSAYSCVSKK